MGKCSKFNVGGVEIEVSVPNGSITAEKLATALYALIVGKIDMPSGGIAGQILRKTSDGTEWSYEQGGEWGSIQGTLSNQTDLQNALNAKANQNEMLIELGLIDTENLGDVRAKSVDMDELPKVCGYPMYIIGTAAPSVTPDFIGQIYIDKQNAKVYIATDIANASSFKVLN